MSTDHTGADERISIQTEEIGVLKEFEPAEFSVPVIRYVIVSNREETVSIRLSDDLPDGFPMDGIKFHPEYEGNNWTRHHPREITFERRIDPGEEVETIYAIQVTEPEEVKAFLTDPEIAEIRPEQEDLTLESGAETVDETTVDDVKPQRSEDVTATVGEQTSEEVTAEGDETEPELDLDSGSLSSSPLGDEEEETTSEFSLDTDIDFDDEESDIDLDEFDHGDSELNTTEDFSIDLDDTDGGTFDTHDESDWDRSRSDSSSFSGLTSGSDPQVTVEVDWTDLPPHLREELVEQMTSDVELSVPLDSIVRKAVEQQVDELFERIDETTLLEAIGTSSTDEQSGTHHDRSTPTDADDTAEKQTGTDRVALVVNGSRYYFEDGETFGRRDEPWLKDLVKAAGDEDHVTYISSQHVEFSIEDGTAYVTDVSRNGTSLNNTDLDGDTKQLSDGDVLRLAGVVAVKVEL